MNETLCPTDFKQAGQIVDDDLNRALINQVPQGVSLMCCYHATFAVDTDNINDFFQKLQLPGPSFQRFAACACVRHICC